MKRGAKKEKLPDIRLLKVCKLLNANHAKYVVIGGVALNLHGLIRATMDIDLLIPKDIKNTKEVLDTLKNLAFGIASELDPADVTNKPITIIGDIPRVDLLTVANKIKYEDAINTVKTIRIDGIKITYVDIDTLIKTKETGRLQDKADIERLKKIYSINT
mgnify:CR=1 FL=1